MTTPILQPAPLEIVPADLVAEILDRTQRELAQLEQQRVAAEAAATEAETRPAGSGFDPTFNDWALERLERLLATLHDDHEAEMRSLLEAAEQRGRACIDRAHVDADTIVSYARALRASGETDAPVASVALGEALPPLAWRLDESVTAPQPASPPPAAIAPVAPMPAPVAPAPAPVVPEPVAVVAPEPVVPEPVAVVAPVVPEPIAVVAPEPVAPEPAPVPVVVAPPPPPPVAPVVEVVDDEPTDPPEAAAEPAPAAETGVKGLLARLPTFAILQVLAVIVVLIIVLIKIG